MNNKFKTGDRVVCTRNYPITKVGDVGVIEESSWFGERSEGIAPYWFDHNHEWRVRVEDLEHEDVFNSPLYKALS